jgi:hypothetical protein
MLTLVCVWHLLWYVFRICSDLPRHCAQSTLQCKVDWAQCRGKSEQMRNCVHASTFQSFALAGVEQLYGCIHMGRMNLLDVSTHVKPLDGCLHLITLASAGSRHICVDAWPSCERVSSLCLIIHLPLDMLVSTCRCTWKGCTCTVARIMVPVAVPSTDHVFWITRPADTDRYGAQDACHRDAPATNTPLTFDL